MLLEEVFLNILFLLFPLLIYFLMMVYTSNLNKKQNELLFDLACATSIYLMIRFYSYFTYTNYFLLLINIPFLMSILYKRKICSILLAGVIVVYYVHFYHFPFWVIFFEYFLYLFLFYSFFSFAKKSYFKIYLFTFLKGILLSIEFFYFLPNHSNYITTFVYLSFILFLFAALAFFIFYLNQKTEEVSSYHRVLKELEREKTIKNALFQITHEIKNPIAVCKGYLTMMNYDDIPAMKKYHQIIRGEIEKTLQLLDDFKDYNKIHIQKEIMDLVMLIDECLFSMQSLLKLKDVTVVKSMEEEVFILGDYRRLMQVVVNILKNSIEAMEDGFGKIEIQVKDNQSYVELSFLDNGSGIAPEVFEHLGELFYTTKPNGTGLGVSLSKQIIALHQGTITYYPQEVGTLVQIMLPKGEIDK